ncbi:LytR/AlgR family response regulator transcription factor [Haloimpatiens sp. FM7315]|uniref:LytR/AlgR family response regulator transcription factor n=1 Tax=Haloimpatiens sp. FM7315 TaxID=3298609 RepID=UPI00370AC201
MIDIAICDDEREIVSRIKKYIEEYDKYKCSIHTYSSGEELLFERKRFQVIFLDIDMKGINGIETAENLRKYDKNVKIIYITNFTDYVNLAFQVHAFGYLNKPICKEDIYTQLDEAVSYLESKEDKNIVEFKSTDGVIRLAPKDICYFEYINRKVKIKTLDNIYMIKDKITNIAEYMKKYGFQMPHKSFTVNLFYVKSIKGYDIFMMDGTVIPLSQKKSQECRGEFNVYLEKYILNT